MCPGTYIPLSEMELYEQKALKERLVDQQVRAVDIGKANVGIGRVHRGKLDKPSPNSVAEHDHVSEVYHVISGSATLVLGPDILNRDRRPATMPTVVLQNGPGNNGSEVRDGVGGIGSPEIFQQKQVEQGIRRPPQNRPSAMPGWRLSERRSDCTMARQFMSHHRGGNR